MNKDEYHLCLPKLIQSVAVLSAVYEAGSFSAAADRLGLDQSAVSHRIRALEAGLRLKLFERTTRSVKPTRAGTILCETAKKVTSDLAMALTAAREIRSAASIRLSLPSSLATKWLLPALTDAHHHGLDLSLDVRESLVELDQGSVEAAVRFGPGPYPGYHAIRLARCAIQPVASPAYIAARAVAGDLFSQPDLVCLADRRGEQDGTGFSWSEYVRALDSSPNLPRPSHYFDRTDLMLQAAIGGMGVALGRSLLIEEDIRQGLLVPIGPPAKMASAYWLVTSYELAQSDRIARLEDWLRRQVEQTLHRT